MLARYIHINKMTVSAAEKKQKHKKTSISEVQSSLTAETVLTDSKRTQRNKDKEEKLARKHKKNWKNLSSKHSVSVASCQIF